MKCRIRPLSLITLVIGGLLTVMPATASAQQRAPESPEAAGHSAHQPAAPAQPQGRIEELIAKMHAATGEAKTAVMADLIDLLVKERHSCEAMMEGKTMPMAKPAATPAAPPAPNAPSR
jgi:hypothetical protein